MKWFYFLKSWMEQIFQVGNKDISSADAVLPIVGIGEQHFKRGLDLFASSHPGPMPPSASCPQVEWGARKARAAKSGEVSVKNSPCRTAVIYELGPIADTNWVSRGMGICSYVLVFGSQAWWKGTTQPIKFGSGSCEMLQQRDHPLWLLVIR